MDLVACLQTSALAGGHEHLIVGAACAVTIASLGFGVQRGVVQRIMVGVLFAFVLLLLLGSVYVDCLRPALF